MEKFILALDQGTTSCRALLFDKKGTIVSSAQKEFTQHFPKSGWVEHDALEIWNTQADMMKSAISQKNISPESIAAIGITNQRETVV
ncbi:MAG: FGGY family carbohydrate kinase, partial [Muriicola sp.]